MQQRYVVQSGGKEEHGQPQQRQSLKGAKVVGGIRENMKAARATQRERESMEV